MYSFVLALHNILRWVVLLTGVIAVVNSYRGLFSRAPWTPRDRGMLSAYAATLGVQFLIGLLLYVWLSPLTRTGFGNMGAAMRDPALRLFVIEHPLTMLIGITLANIAQARARKAATDAARFRIAAILLTISLVLVLARIPWARPLFPAF
jgi:hypothetical protein